MLNRRNTMLAAAGAAASLALPQGVLAQAWPDKPIRMVVAFPAGGGLDLVARTVAQRLSEILRQQVVVDNRGGANGAIGADLVAKSAPDGYTLLMASPAEVVVGPVAGQKVPYDPEKDLVPVALAGEAPLVIAAHPSVPANSLKEFVAYAKAHPGRLSYGTPGTGSSMHFAGESLKSRAGAFLVHIPYRGAAPALNDALGNQVSVAIVGMPPVVPHAKAGRLKVLGVTTAKRSPVMPDVPAVAELPGLSDYRFTNWMGVFAPARTPAPVLERLSSEIARLVKEPAVREKLNAAGVEAMGLNAAEFGRFLQGERNSYQTIARERAIRIEE